MESNNAYELEFIQFRGKLEEKISYCYGNVVQTVNESLTTILQNTIFNAESLEKFVKIELSELASTIFISNNIKKGNEKTKVVNNGIKNDSKMFQVYKLTVAAYLISMSFYGWRDQKLNPKNIHG